MSSPADSFKLGVPLDFPSGVRCDSGVSVLWRPFLAARAGTLHVTSSAKRSAKLSKSSLLLTGPSITPFAQPSQLGTARASFGMPSADPERGLIRYRTHAHLSLGPDHRQLFSTTILVETRTDNQSDARQTFLGILDGQSAATSIYIVSLSLSDRKKPGTGFVRART
jgi:hypothetical protein